MSAFDEHDVVAFVVEGREVWLSDVVEFARWELGRPALVDRLSTEFERDYPDSFSCRTMLEKDLPSSERLVSCQRIVDEYGHLFPALEAKLNG